MSSWVTVFLFASSFFSRVGVCLGVSLREVPWEAASVLPPEEAPLDPEDEGEEVAVAVGVLGGGGTLSSSSSS
jgi:hypothetical protein